MSRFLRQLERDHPGIVGVLPEADPLGLLAAGAIVFGAQKLVPTFDASWYKAVKKPNWTPANWVFPAVWIPLKLAQSLALFLAFKQVGFGETGRVKAQKLAMPLAFFGTMIALGNYWNVCFFGQRRLKASINVMALFLQSVIASSCSFWTAGSPLAGLLVAPTAIWVAIAAKLNYDIVALNPELHEKDA